MCCDLQQAHTHKTGKTQLYFFLLVSFSCCCFYFCRINISRCQDTFFFLNIFFLPSSHRGGNGFCLMEILCVSFLQMALWFNSFRFEHQTNTSLSLLQDVSVLIIFALPNSRQRNFVSFVDVAGCSVSVCVCWMFVANLKKNIIIAVQKPATIRRKEFFFVFQNLKYQEHIFHE